MQVTAQRICLLLGLFTALVIAAARADELEMVRRHAGIQLFYSPNAG